MADRVELITYADRLGGDLPGLAHLLATRFAGLFGGVHVLPFFRPFDGADAGFDPADHTEVDARLGTWDDIAALAQAHDLTVDVIVNHVSSSSPQFLDWLAHGSDSEWDGMFLTFAGAFPDGATEDVLMRLYRPRPGLPFTPYTLADGTKRLLWTTFTSQQVDIDVRHPTTRAYLRGVIARIAAAGVRRVRLDAVGYAVKTPGLTSFMTAETFRFIDDVTAWCHEQDLEVLVEVHSYYRRQIEIARQVDRVYDFALPPLVLHALLAHDADPLLAWMAIRPTNAITVLDTHDGIGVVDVGADGTDRSRPGLLGPDQLDALVESIHDASGGTSRLATGAAASNVDLYQVNCTFYDALGRSDDRYLLARALQFWTPGTPQVYYVGLLAGTNDIELLNRTTVGRDVNRHHYTSAEIDESLTRPVVQALLRLIRFRNAHPAFGGDCVVDGGGSAVTMTWTSGADLARLEADVATGAATVTWTADGTQLTAPLDGLP
ncbi:sucrose phosphorylase [Humibacillus xanthopallidus]|uniref:Sucrose phosphorylase n=1 Tax=Humibacillus xanthopallidus TaxID=412689 RepID=A0A543HG32_9MICO|nr:sucrose phosphorylase [Humibacillus xanthopallidus]TQM57295.1 sucrose phosphorylase [Humibacillus xanthopallidus]